MKIQRITLDVPFDEHDEEIPMMWDWDTIIGNFGCIVVGADPIREWSGEINEMGTAVPTHQSDPE